MCMQTNESIQDLLRCVSSRMRFWQTISLDAGVVPWCRAVIIFVLAIFRSSSLNTVGVGLSILHYLPIFLLVFLFSESTLALCLRWKICFPFSLEMFLSVHFWEEQDWRKIIWWENNKYLGYLFFFFSACCNFQNMWILLSHCVCIFRMIV
jgi:hypothetical protein